MDFDKTQMTWDGEYLMYKGQDSGERNFVARFKRKCDRTKFAEFLRKNFTVEEYFSHRAAGVAPLTILESKGFVSATVQKILKNAGYPATQEGKQKYLDDQVAARAKV